jgi:haloacid dehalogenase-like hydrolase
MSDQHAILAVIFDFDDTLLPDSTTALLKSAKIDTTDFWNVQARKLAETGFEPNLAYLHLLLGLVGKNKPLGALSNAMLRAFGASLNKAFFVGIPQLFNDLRKVAATVDGVDIEFYIVSSGLAEIIRGSKIIQKNFKEIYGCEFAEDPATGCICHLKRCVTFTEKTRFIFEINKGISATTTAQNPMAVNQDRSLGQRRIPFQNMIYVGDGLTDIPCFSLVSKNGGTAFGVFHPTEQKSAKRAFLEFLKTGRVVSCHAPKYRSTDELGSLLRAAVATRCQAIKIERQATGDVA